MSRRVATFLIGVTAATGSLGPAPALPRIGGGRVRRREFVGSSREEPLNPGLGLQPYSRLSLLSPRRALLVRGGEAFDDDEEGDDFDVDSDDDDDDDFATAGDFEGEDTLMRRVRTAVDRTPPLTQVGLGV